MAGALNGARVCFLVHDEGVEQVELTDPWQAVRAAGGEPELVAPATGTVQAFRHLDRADTFEATRAAADARAGDYAGLVLPGGVANADALRTHRPAVELVRAFAAQGTPIAVICHGPWILIEAAAVAGRRMTSWPSLQTDLRNAGADWHDEALVECHAGPFTLVSSRKPDDLPAFCGALVDALAVQLAGRPAAGSR